ncbi:hypothetical protein HK096_003489 [Nowakowskiella sp. JEL0078]|nr:hypothetical protein HK096_003489 [Nowakowskiella sp. JEL0078]
MYEDKEEINVAFQGIHGAHSEEALLSLFKDSKWENVIVLPKGVTSFEKVFDAIQSNEVKYGFVPVENSATGTYHFIYDMLYSNSVYIVGEYCHHDNHCLLAAKGTSINSLTKIISHSYAFDQCRYFIATLSGEIQLSQSSDTAVSAAMIKSENLENTAAIASLTAAKIYDLKVLKESIEDNPDVVTRYLLISKSRETPERHMSPRTSFSLTLKNQIGSFFKALSCFALRDINVLKVESRPSVRSIQLSRPWEYILYIDVDGAESDFQIQNAIKNLEEFALTVIVLGSYPRYQNSGNRANTTLGIGM